MPVKGYDSVNVPTGLYENIKALINNRNDLGYRSITEFVAEAIRTKLTEINKTTPNKLTRLPHPHKTKNPTKTHKEE